MEKERMMKIGSVALAVALVFSYVAYQIVQISKKGIETQIAMSETVYDTIDTKCFVLRDEKYLNNTATGTVISFAKNGERVAAGDTVTMVFPDTADADTYRKISELKKEIKHYEALAGQANIQAVDISSLDGKVNKQLFSLLETVEKRDFSNLNEQISSFRSSSNAKQIATGEVLNYDETLAKLKAECASLQLEKLDYSVVKSTRAGYYIAGADGYEQTLTYSKVDSLKTKDIEEAISAKPMNVPKSVVGRSVGAFEWYMLCVVDTDEISALSTGQEITVNFPYAGLAGLSVKVYKIGEKTEDKTILILSCSLMNDQLASLRCEDIQIVTQSFTGYKLSNTAIRTVDGETGVYVVSGNLCNFRKVHVVYATDSYTIVDNPQGDSGYIRLYDKVVVKGVELYDDKLI